METCRGITKSGNRCRATVGLVDGYCRLHRQQAGDVSESSEQMRKSEPEPAEKAYNVEEPALQSEYTAMLRWGAAAAALLLLLAMVLCGKRDD